MDIFAEGAYARHMIRFSLRDGFLLMFEASLPVQTCSLRGHVHHTCIASAPGMAVRTDYNPQQDSNRHMNEIKQTCDLSSALNEAGSQW